MLFASLLFNACVEASLPKRTPANRYTDTTFTKDGFTLTNGVNSFTVIAKTSLGLNDTNTISVNLPATNTFAYDLNGNLRTNGPII